MTSKRQFLDPIGAGCRLILLQFSAPNTKIRITDHTIQLVEDTYSEKIFFRPWYFKDSREDMSALYPMIVRFIELYLIGKKGNCENTTKEQSKGKKIQGKKQSGNSSNPSQTSIGLQPFNFLDQMNCEQTETARPVIVSETDDSASESDTMENDTKCYEYLKKLAQYMIKGMARLEETYGQCTATFTLQFYCNLLKSGIEGTYTQDLLPTKMREFTASQDLINSDKIKNLWDDPSIIALGELFEKCFEAHEKSNNQMIMAYGSAISSILDCRDEEFKQMMQSTDCA